MVLNLSFAWHRWREDNMHFYQVVKDRDTKFVYEWTRRITTVRKR